MRKICALAVVGAMPILLVSACGGKQTPIKVAPAAPTAMPEEWDWVLRDDSSKLITIDELSRVYPAGSTNPVTFQLECTAASSELSTLDGQVLAPSYTPSPPGEGTYFTVKNMPYEFVDFAERMASIDAKIGAKISPVTLKTKFGTKSTTINLVLAFTNWVVHPTSKYIDCVKNSLKNAGHTGKFEVPDAILVGGLAVMAFSAERTDGQVIASYADVASAELDVNLSDTKVTYSQWGAAPNLSTPDIMKHLKADALDPSGALHEFEKTVTKRGYVGARRRELAL